MTTTPRRRLRIDLTPLRASRGFRLLFASGIVTAFGSMMTMVALPFQVAELTGSFVAVGLLGVAELVPLVAFGLYGGALADALDRRRMLVLTEIASGVLVLVLAANSLLAEPHVWVVYVVSVLFAAVDGLQRPSMEAAVPRLVRHDDLAAAGALSSLKWNVSSIAGPAVGGIVIAAWGVGAAYAVDAMTFAISIVLLLRLPRMPAAGGDSERPGLRHVADGLRYAWSRRDLMGTYLVDLAAMAFAFPYALFPFMVDEFSAPWSLGMLYAAPAVGALIVTVTSGWLSHTHRHGRLLVWSAVVWGFAIGLTGVAPTIWWVLALLVIAGAADMLSGQFRLLMWNMTIPDEVRGRMAGIELLSYSIGPLLGQVRSTTAAQLTSLRMSLASGGLLCVVAVIGVAATIPSLWRYDDRTDPNAVRERRVRQERGTTSSDGE